MGKLRLHFIEDQFGRYSVYSYFDDTNIAEFSLRKLLYLLSAGLTLY